MSDSSLADGKAGVDANLDGPAKRRQIRNIVERKRKEKIKHYITAIAKLLPTDRLEHKERNSTNAILEAAWRYMVDLREQNDRLLLERGTDVHNQEISRLKCLLSEAREDRDRMERMLQHCASVPAGFDPLTQWHKQGSSASGSGDGPADHASSARSSAAQDKPASEPLSSTAGATLSKGTLLAAANAGGVLLPTVASGGLCNGAAISAAASGATSGGKPLCIPPNLGQGLIITQSGQAIFLNEQGVAVAQGLIGGALPGLVSRPDETAAVRDGASSIGSRSVAPDGELSASGASSLDSSAAAGSTSPAPVGSAADGQAQASRLGACRLQPSMPSSGVAAVQSGLALGTAAAAGAAMSAVNAQPSGLASATRFAGSGAGTALALHPQSGGLVAMAAGQATGGIVAVPGQPGQLPSAFLLPNGQIIPVVTQPQALQPVAPAQLAAAAAAVPLAAADVLTSSCKAASVSSSTPPLLFTTASGSAAVTTTVTTGTVTTSRAASLFQHPATTLTAAAAPTGSAGAAGGAGAMSATGSGSLMYVALPPAMSLQPSPQQQQPAPQQSPQQQQQQSLGSTACSTQQQAAIAGGGAQLMLDAGCFSGAGAEHLKAAAAAAAAGGQRLIMPKPTNFAGSVVHHQQQPPLPQPPQQPPPPTTSSTEGVSSAKSKRKAKKGTGSVGAAAAGSVAAAAAGVPGIPVGNAAGQHADLDTDILAKAAESIFSDGGGSSSAAHFGPTDDNPLQIDMDNAEHDTDVVATATLLPEAAGAHATSHAQPTGVERWRQELQPEELALGVGSCARSGADRVTAATSSSSKQPGGGQGEVRYGSGSAPAAGAGGSKQPSEAASRRRAVSGACAAAVAATSPAAAAPGSLQKSKAVAAAAAASGIVDAKLAGATGSEAAVVALPAKSAKKPSTAKRSRGADPDARASAAGSKSDAGRSVGSSSSSGAEQNPKRKRKPSAGNTTPSLAAQPPSSSAAHQQPAPFYEAAGVAACPSETADGPDIPESIQFSEDDLDLVLDQVENLDAAPALTATIGSTAAASAAVTVAAAASAATIASQGNTARPYGGQQQPPSTAKRSLGTEACLAAVDAEIRPVFSLGRPPSTSADRESGGSDGSAANTRAGREAARTPSAVAAAAAETAVGRAAEMTDRPGQRLSDGSAAAGVPPPRPAAEQPKRNRDGSRMPMVAAATTPSSADPACSGADAMHLRHDDQVSGSLPSHLLPTPPGVAMASPRLSGIQAPVLTAAASSVAPSCSIRSAIAQEESSYFHSSSPTAVAAAAGPQYDGRHRRKASPAATAAASDTAFTVAERPPSLSSGGASAANSYSASAAATASSSSPAFAPSFYSSEGSGLSHAPSKHSGELLYSPSQLSCRASGGGAAADPSSTPSAGGKQHLFAVPFPPSPKDTTQPQQTQQQQQRLHHPAAGLGSASQHTALQLQRQPSDIGRGVYLNDSSAGQSAPAVRRTATPDGPASHGRHAGLSDATRDGRKSRPSSSPSEEQPIAASAAASAIASTPPPGSGSRLGDVRTPAAAGTLHDAANGGAAPVSPFGSREFVPSALPSSDPFKATATVGSMRSSSYDPASVGSASAELLYGGSSGRSGVSSGSLVPPRNNGGVGGGGSGRDVDFSAEALLSPSYPLARIASSGAHMPVCTAAGAPAAGTMFLPQGSAIGDFHAGPKAHGHSMAAYDLLHTASQRQVSVPSSTAGQGFSAVLSKQVGAHVSSSATTAYGGKDGIASMASGKETAPFNVNFFSASGSDYGGGDGGRSIGGGGGATAPGARCTASASTLSPFMPYGAAGSAVGDSSARLSETGFTFSLTPTTNSSATAAAAAAAAVAANQAAFAHRQFFFPMPDSLLHHHHSRSDDLFRPSAAAYQQHPLVHSPGDKSAQQSSPTSLPKQQQQQRAAAVDLGSGGGAKLSHSAVNLYSSSFDSLMQPQHDFGQQQQQQVHHHHQQQQQQSQQHHLQQQQQQQHRRYDERDMQGISVGMYDIARTAATAAPSSPAAGSSGGGQQSSDKSRGGKAAKQLHDKPHHAQKKQRYDAAAAEPYDLAAATSRTASASCVSASPSSMSSASPSPLFHGAASSLLSRQDMSAYVPFPHPIGTIRTEASSSLPPHSVGARSAGTAPADLFGSLYSSPARPSTAATGLGLPFAAAAAAFSSVRPPVAASPSSSSSSMSAGGALVPPVHPSTAGLPMHSQFNLSNLFGEAMVGSQAAAGALRGFPHGLLPPPPSQDGSSLYAARSAMLPHNAMSLNSLLGHHGHGLDPGSSSGSGGIPGSGSGHSLGPSMPSFASHPHPMMGFGLPAPSLNFTMPDH